MSRAKSHPTERKTPLIRDRPALRQPESGAPFPILKYPDPAQSGTIEARRADIGKFMKIMIDTRTADPLITNILGIMHSFFTPVTTKHPAALPPPCETPTNTGNSH